MIVIINTSVVERNGKPAIWLEGGKLQNALNPQDRYEPLINEGDRVLRFVRSEDGSKVVSVRGKNSSTPKPLIEYKDEDILRVFKVGDKLRVVCLPGRVEIRIHAAESQRAERLERYRQAVASRTIKKGSYFIGGGVLDRAIHDGLKLAGFDSYVKVAVESESKYVEALLSNQPDLFRNDSILLNSRVEDVEFRGAIKLDLVSAGIPCTGASKSGRTKNKLTHAEQHHSAGACFFHTLNFVKQVQPWIVIFENVPEYINTASYAVIKQVLSDWGYVVTEKTLNGCEYGCLESRDRMVMVAVTEGMPEFDFEQWLVPLREKENSLADVLEDVPLDSEEWRSYDYLVAKESRDKAAGKGFKRDIYDGSEGRVGTIRRLYHKGGSTDQYLVHPENPSLFRQFRKTEHAKIKAVPLFIIDGLGKCIAHEILGQGVAFFVFVSLGHGLGNYILDGVQKKYAA